MLSLRMTQQELNDFAESINKSFIYMEDFVHVCSKCGDKLYNFSEISSEDDYPLDNDIRNFDLTLEDQENSSTFKDVLDIGDSESSVIFKQETLGDIQFVMAYLLGKGYNQMKSYVCTIKNFDNVDVIKKALDQYRTTNPFVAEEEMYSSMMCFSTGHAIMGDQTGHA